MILAAALHLASALRYADDDVAAELDRERLRELLQRRRQSSVDDDGDEGERET